MSSQNLLSLEDVSIGYQRKVVAERISMSIGGGTLACLLGRNGCGKSTLLKTIAGFLPKLGGTVALDGKPLSLLSQDELARTVGVVLTGRALADNLTVREMASMGRSPYTGFFGRLSEEDWDIVDDALRQVGMEAIGNRKVSTLSDGEYQKTMIAKTLAQQTPVILLDEPTAFLDFPSKVGLMETVGRLAHDKRKAVIMSTHDINLAVRLADEMWLMRNGSVARCESKEDIYAFIGEKAAYYL